VNFLEKKNAICYYRVSSKHQAEKQSINLQKHSLKEFAEKKGYDIIDEPFDDGISGESIDSRPGFQKALAAIEEGGVDFLLVYMVDRIGRFASRKDRNLVVELLESSQTNVDSPYDGLFPWDDEKRLNELEGALNESRLDNKRRAKRISEGHKTVRINGGFSGGRVPYGVRYVKKRNKFYKHPKEVATLKVIFSKLRGGLGIHRTAKFLSQNLKKYPLPKMKRTYRKDNPILGVKRGDPKPANAWNAGTVRSFAHRDFYFTGIIKPSPAAAKNGLPQVDTKIRLFSEEEVKAAREEMRIRRWTTKRGNDKIKTHLLFLGFVRCAYCGWKLSPYYAEYKNGIPKRVSYRCLGRNNERSTGCKFKNVRAKVLDNLLWKAFIKLAEDPEELEKRILEEEFIVDKDRADLKAMKNQATAKLEDYEAKLKRFNWLVFEGELPKDQYLEFQKEIKIERQKAEEQLEKANAALRRPRDIKHAVKRATKIVAEQMILLRYLNQIKETKDKVDAFAELKYLPEDLRQENWIRVLAKLEKDEFYDRLFKLIDKLKAKVTITTADLANKEISQLMYQQKRVLFQQYFDPERGIEVWSKDRFEIHLSIPKMATDELGSKQIKSLRHPNRPA
jgi:DNA invertase Pin-like site-specific DNA recombinase